MNNDTFLIEHDYIEDAHSICDYIEDSMSRSRAVANNLAANISVKYFSEIEVDTESGLHNIFYVLNDIEISDIYVKNNYIDVRFYFDNNNILVPKSHFDYNIQPVAYMFIKLDEDLMSGNVTGFIFPENINTQNEYNGYYKISENDLVSYYDIEQRLVTNDTVDLSDNIEPILFDYLDGRLNKNEKEKLYQLLLNSKESRELLFNIAKAKNLFNFIHFDSSNDTISNNESSELLDYSTNESVDLDLNVEPTTLVDTNDYNLLESSSDESFILDEMPSENIVELNSLGVDGLTPDNSAPIEDNVVDTSYMTEEQDNHSENNLYIENNDNITVDNVSVDSEIDENTPNIDMNLYEENISYEINKDITETNQQSDNTEISYQNTKQIDDFEELEKYNYETYTTPSITNIENNADYKINEITEGMLDDEPDNATTEMTNETGSYDTNTPQIEELFNNNHPRVVNTSKKKNSILPLISTLAILGFAGYFCYTKFYLPSTLPNNIQNDNVNMEIETTQAQKDTEKEDLAMPVETVDNVEQLNNSVEGNASSIPSIEQNLDATIDVSNLTINWEVPASYTTNTTAKRYFVRIGKILQLNLKTEMLLLSSSPITNKISLELEFDKNISKFRVKNIINSSGITKIDNVVKETAEKALNMNLNTNMSVFNTLQGNPTLVINL